MEILSPKKSESNSLKSQNFDGFLGFFVGSKNPSVLSVHGFSGSAKTPKRRKIASQISLLKSHYLGDNAHSFARLLLLPTGTQYPAGSPIPKKSEF